MDVKRIVAVVLLGSTLGIVFFVFWVLLSATDDVSEDAPSWWRGNAYTGLVVEITDDHLSLHTHAGDNLPFKLDGNTRFILRGNSTVKPGIEVKINFRNIRGVDSSFMLARTVRVLKPEPDAPNGENASSSPANAPGSGSPHARSSENPRGSSSGQPNGAASGQPNASPSLSPAPAAK